MRASEPKLQFDHRSARNITIVASRRRSRASYLANIIFAREGIYRRAAAPRGSVAGYARGTINFRGRAFIPIPLPSPPHRYTRRTRIPGIPAYPRVREMRRAPLEPY